MLPLEQAVQQGTVEARVLWEILLELRRSAIARPQISQPEEVVRDALDTLAENYDPASARLAHAALDQVVAAGVSNTERGSE